MHARDQGRSEGALRASSGRVRGDAGQVDQAEEKQLSRSGLRSASRRMDTKRQGAFVHIRDDGYITRINNEEYLRDESVHANRLP